MKFSMLTSVQDNIKPDALHEKKVIAALHALDVSLINNDIKTHLSPIKMCAEMLESHVPVPMNDKQGRMDKTIHRCMDKLEKLVNDASDLYKLESHSLHMIKIDIDIQNFMDNCIHMLRPFIAEKQNELKKES